MPNTCAVTLSGLTLLLPNISSECNLVIPNTCIGDPIPSKYCSQLRWARLEAHIISLFTNISFQFFFVIKLLVLLLWNRRSILLTLFCEAQRSSPPKSGKVAFPRHKCRIFCPLNLSVCRERMVPPPLQCIRLRSVGSCRAKFTYIIAHMTTAHWAFQHSVKATRVSKLYKRVAAKVVATRRNNTLFVHISNRPFLFPWVPRLFVYRL
jgi:hypothetical protein